MPIAETVSKSRAAVRAYLSRTITTSAAVAAIIVVWIIAAIAAIAYITTRLGVTYQQETQIQVLHAELDRLRQDHNAEMQAWIDSVRDLELTVYGTLEPKVKATKPTPVPRVPLALLERHIDELRQRTTQLERFRLQHQREHQQQ